MCGTNENVQPPFSARLVTPCNQITWLQRCTGFAAGALVLVLGKFTHSVVCHPQTSHFDAQLLKLPSQPLRALKMDARQAQSLRRLHIRSNIIDKDRFPCFHS